MLYDTSAGTDQCGAGRAMAVAGAFI